MALDWFRMSVDLPDHFKTVELRAVLGEENVEAYVLRLWAWAMGNAKNGTLPGRRPSILLEHVCRWHGEANILTEALIEVGFIDRAADGTLAIHGWDEMNGAAIRKAERDAGRHKTASDAETDTKENQDVSNGRAGQARGSRGSSAGQARHSERNVTRRDVTKRNEEQPSSADADVVAAELPASELAAPAPTIPEPQPHGGGVQADLANLTGRATVADLVRLWNDTAHPALARCLKCDGPRKKHAEARLKERGLDGPTGFREVIRRINRIPGMLGQVPKADGKPGWRADFDFLVSPMGAVKVLEGKYDSWTGQPSGPAALPPAPAARLYVPGEDLYPDEPEADAKH